MTFRRPGYPCRLPSGSPFSSLPGKSVCVPVIAPIGVPGAGLFPFSNAAGPVPAPSPIIPTASPWSFQWSGSLDASGFETVPLDFPFSQLSLPLTLEARYSFSPEDFRDNDGGVGGFDIVVSSQDKNLGVELQASDPDSIFVLVYSNYVPVDPETVAVTRHDYQAVWPAGTPVVRITVDQDRVPHIYFDGVEGALTDLGTSESTYLPGDYAAASASALAPDHVVNFSAVHIVGALLPPPAAL